MKRTSKSKKAKIEFEDETPEEVKEVEVKVEDRRRLWINKGGTHYMRDGRRIKPGQRFKATPEEIPESFRDKLVPVEALPAEVPTNIAGTSYQVVSHEGNPGFYSVLDATRGKIISEKPLSKAEAEALIKDLTE